MAIQLKTLYEIYAQKKADIQAMFPGALFVNRSLVLALAWAESIQQAEIYRSVGDLLSAFSWKTARGAMLARRALDFGVLVQPATQARGKVVFSDGAFPSRIEGVLSTNYASGVTAITLSSGHNFVNSSSLGKIILGRGTAQQETIQIAGISGDTITLAAPTAFLHSSGDKVYQSTVGSDRTIPKGTIVYVPGLLGAPDTQFSTLADAVILDGDVQSETTDILAVLAGAAGVVGAGRINSIISKPFDTLQVTNAIKTSGGQDRDTDDSLRARIERALDATGQSTPRQLEQVVLGLSVDGDTILRARVKEPVGMGASILYIDDGSGGLSPKYTNIPSPEVIISDAVAGEKRGRIYRYSLNKSSLVLVLSTDEGVASAVGSLSLTDSSKSWVVNAFIGFYLVDDQGAFWTIDSNTATTLTITPAYGAPNTPSLGAYGILDPSNPLSQYDAAKLPLSPPALTDQVLVNYERGEIELLQNAFLFGMNEHAFLVAFDYEYATGVFQEASRVLQGDEFDPDNYPGEVAAGTYVELAIPQKKVLYFTISISALQGFTEAELRPLVQDTVIQYVNGLGLASTVYLSEIIARIRDIVGIRDVKITYPTENPRMSESELPTTDTAQVSVN